MALSTTESALLTQTCENMNIAANTCREVLEMLRNLGNTGVVDIATHNNTPGAHASDNTLAHVVNVSGNTSYLSLGDSIYSSWGGQSSTPVHIRWNNVGNGPYKSTDIVLQNNSLGLSLANAIYYRNEIFLTDTNGNRAAFSNYDQSLLYGQPAMMHTFRTTDSEGDSLSSRIAAMIGRSASWGDTESTASSPYTRLQFDVANGFGSTAVAFVMDSGGLVPGSSNTMNLGNSSRVFKDLYLKNAVTVTSDRRAKKNISPIGSEAVDFIKSLRPVSFKMLESSGQVEKYGEDGEVKDVIPATEGVRTHWGLIAQEVKEAMTQAGIEDAAVWCLADKDDPDSKQSLRYEELIAPLVKAVQVLAAKVEALEGK